MAVRTLSLFAALSLCLATCNQSPSPSGAVRTSAPSAAGAKASQGAPTATGANASLDVALPLLGLKGKVTGEKQPPFVGSEPNPVQVEGATFTARVSEAAERDPKTLTETLSQVKPLDPKNVRTETLADGWSMTFEAGVYIFVVTRRTLGGKAYRCECTEDSPERASAALAFCKSLSK